MEDQSGERPLDRTTVERLHAVSRRNTRLTRQLGALEESRQHLLETLAHVSLVAGRGSPDVAREIVSVAEQVAARRRADRRFLEALRS